MERKPIIVCFDVDDTVEDCINIACLRINEKREAAGLPKVNPYNIGGWLSSRSPEHDQKKMLKRVVKIDSEVLPDDFDPGEIDLAFAQEVTPSDVPQDVIDALVDLFHDPVFVASQPAYPDALRVITALNANPHFRVMFVTAVPASVASVRMLKLMSEFGVKENQIIIASDKSVVHGDFLLDDNANNVRTSPAKMPVLFRRPWNKHATGVMSVSSFDEFYTLLTDYERRRFPMATLAGDKNIVCLVGPEGSGKRTIIRRLCRLKGFGSPAAVTTAEKTEFQQLSEEEFYARKAKGEFVETAAYGGAYYALTPKSLEDVWAEGKTAVCAVDIGGANALKTAYPGHVISVFIDQEDKFLYGAIQKLPRDVQVQRFQALPREKAAAELCDYAVATSEATDFIRKIMKGQ